MLGNDVRRDARSGDADAQFELGCMYHDGYGVRQDYLEAATWYRRAAEQGHASGQFNLGLMHWLGVGALPSDRVSRFPGTAGLAARREPPVQTKKHLPGEKTLERRRERAEKQKAGAPAKVEAEAEAEVQTEAEG